jgi:transposase-like protein
MTAKTEALLEALLVEKPKHQLEEVEIIASGYEFDCPECDAYNTLAAIPSYGMAVECRSCHKQFAVGESHHAQD